MSHDLSELTTRCIRCGFCLEACPTFKLTGDETESPRGRIYLVRSALEGKLDWKSDVAQHIDQCLGCRACETACPSGVRYGSIFELAKEQIEQKRPRPATKMLLGGLTDPSKARVEFTLAKFLPGRRLPAALNRLVSAGPAEASIPAPQPRASYRPLDERELPPVQGEVGLLLGCVMRVLYNPVHEATKRLLRRCGYKVVEIKTPCCGALHAHSGHLKAARQRAHRLVRESPSGIPILVNSAGCGSTMKEYGELDPSLSEFAARVQDVSEFLLANSLTKWLSGSKGIHQKVTYHDACHLAHGQQVSAPPRELLRAIPGVQLVELQEADTCCGSAGIYNIQQPAYARKLLERKWAFIEATGARLVATGNPGCHAWIEQASQEKGSRVRVLHTMQVLEASFSGLPD